LAEERRRITEYEKLRRFFLWHRGKFALGLVRVNHPRQRDGILASLQEELAREGVTLLVRNFSQRQVRSLKEELRRDEELREHLAHDSQGVALALVGLEPSIETEPYPGGKIPAFLSSLNLERDAISLGYPIPITFWLTDYAMDRLVEGAVDFCDFKSGVFVFRFAPPQTPMRPEELAPREEAKAVLPLELLQERRDILEDRILELRRKGPLEAAEKERLAELLMAVAETYLASEDAKVKTQGIPYLGDARRIYQELGKRKEEAEALVRMAEAYYWADQNRLAKERYQEALPIFREIGARLGEANTIRALGHVHMALDEYQEARSRYQEALPIYREIGHRLGEANTIKALGDVHMALDEYQEARARYQEALPIYREIGHRLGEANTIMSLGDVHMALDEYQEARSRYQEALPIYREIGHRLGEANTIRALGDVDCSLKDYDSALARYEETMAIYHDIGDRYSIAGTFWRMGQAWEEQGEIQRAIEAFREAEAIFGEIGVRHWEEQCREVMEELEGAGSKTSEVSETSEV